MKGKEDNVVIPMPCMLTALMDQLNMVQDDEISNFFVNNILDLAKEIVLGEELTMIRIVDIARKYNIEFTNEQVLTNFTDIASKIVMEFASEIMLHQLEPYDLEILSCLNEKILIKKGAHNVRKFG